MLLNKVYYVGEARILAFYPERNNGRIIPDSATIQVTDSEGVDVVPVTAAGITGQKVYYLANESNVMAEAGQYIVRWVVHYGDEVKRVKHRITVEEF